MNDADIAGTDSTDGSGPDPVRMLTLADLDQQQIDTITQAIDGGSENLKDLYPLSPVQDSILFHRLLNERSTTYVLSALIELQSEELVERLAGALQEVIDRHDALRSAVVWENLSKPVQVVWRSAKLLIEEVALDPSRNPIEQLKGRMKLEPQTFDLSRAPLVLLQVARGAGATAYAILRLHHLICDHQSWGAVIEEVKLRMQGGFSEPRSSTAYRDYMTAMLREAGRSEAQAFFRSKLGDIDASTAPFGLLNVHGDGLQAGEGREVLDPALAKSIRTQAKRFGVGAARLFHAAWGLVVARTTSRDDVVFGTVLRTAEREERRTDRAVGPFINTLPLRLRLQNATAQSLLAQTHEELGQLLAHRQTPLPIAQSCSGIVGGPLFTSVLNYRYSVGHHVADPNAASLGNGGVRVVAHHERNNFPIALTADNFGDRFSLTAQAAHGVDPHRLISYVQTALRSLVKALEMQPETPALELSIVPLSERSQVVDAFNALSVPLPDRMLHELFEDQVRRTPDSVAIEYDGVSLTYAELNRKANQLARHLRSRGVAADQIVGICMERSLEMVLSLLAVWKAGGAYMPLDPSHPMERLAFVLEEAMPKVVLIQERQRDKFSNAAVVAIAVDSSWSEIDQHPALNLVSVTPSRRGNRLAYVIYTSGSTGRPKGVMIEHESVVNLWQGLEKIYGRSRECRRVAWNAAFTFDASVQQLVQLLSGRTLAIIPQEKRLDAMAMRAFVEERRIEAIDCTPTQLKAWIAAGLLDSSECSLRLLLVGGEAIDAALWADLSGRKSIDFYNVYGPTECTVDATSARLISVDGVPHIGRSMANRRIYILDNRRQPVPIGVAGGIFIGGAGVGRGYLNRPILTAERFVPDPFDKRPSARMYETGDLARQREDGAIEYLGRNDGQVKIRGYRIELGEIEARLIQHEWVENAVVLAREDASEEKYLAAYVVATRSTADGFIESLRAHLKAGLPEYMVPSAFVVVDHLPMTSSGKVDRRALPAPDSDAYASGTYDPPQGETEESVAAVWQSLLHVKRIGRQDNVFDLGANSLLVLKALLRINQVLGVSLKVVDIYKSPTIRELVACISGQVAEDERLDLSVEAALDDQLVALPGTPRVPARAVLLTGATGFIGRFLLAQLLQDEGVTVYCIIRAPSQQQASFRLRAILEKWDLWQEGFEDRIVAVRGDLRLPRLGVDDSTHAVLCQEVDSIYHCATSMNHLETYSMAKQSNVESARELVKMAVSVRPKVINYISTISVFSASAQGTARIVHEGSPIDYEEHSSALGYSASKWVGEKIFMVANDRNIPCNIFRLGMIWGDSVQGRYDELQSDYRIIKSCLISGYGIKNYRHEPSPVPVDYAVKAIEFLARQHPKGGGVFHIASNQLAENVFERLNDAVGMSLELLPYYDWIREMKRLHKNGQVLPVIPLIEYAFSMDEASFHDQQRRLRSSRVRFDCARTHKELVAAGIATPELSDGLMRVCMNGMLSHDVDLQNLHEMQSMPITQRMDTPRDIQLR